MTKGKKPTINDIARETGYSKSTVSFAFNNPNRIGEKARDYIRKVADELGYIPDPMARNFSLQQHRSIGFLLPQLTEYSLRNPYIVEIFLGISEVCQNSGFTMTIIPPLNESLSDAVRNAPVDGLIALGMKVEMDIVNIMQTRKLPYVTIDGVPSLNMPSVNIDDESAAYDMMHKVLELGHRDITILSLCRDAYFSENEDGVVKRRLAGYQRALIEFGLSLDSPSVSQFESECNLQEAKLAARKIEESGKNPTVIVAMADILAIGCIRYFASKGVRIPQDLSIVGFDNIPESSYVTPGLTTVDQPGFDKGTKATKMLLKMIKNEDIENPKLNIISDYSLKMRESLSKPASRQ